MKETIMTAIETYKAANGLTDTMFGKMCAGDPNLVFDLRDGGRAPNLRTVEKILLFCAGQPQVKGIEMATKPKAKAKPAVKAKAKATAKKIVKRK